MDFFEIKDTYKFHMVKEWMGDWDADPKIDNKWSKIFLEYSKPERTYHNLYHILRVLNRITMIGDHLGYEAPRELYLAAIYHDIIYIPGEPGNELMSAGYAFADTSSHLDPKSSSEIMRLIMLTEKHETEDDDIDGKILIDADLYELSTNNYQENSENIRKEFAKFSDEEWEAGREAFLTPYIHPKKKEKIFYFDDGIGNIPPEGLTTLARLNMRKELIDILKRKQHKSTDIDHNDNSI